MSHHDKFWEKFAQKLGGHQPDGWKPSDWEAMQELLQQNPVAGAQGGTAVWRGLAGWKGAGLILLLGLGAYIIGAQLTPPVSPKPFAQLERSETATAIGISAVEAAPAARLPQGETEMAGPALLGSTAAPLVSSSAPRGLALADAAFVRRGDAAAGEASFAALLLSGASAKTPGAGQMAAVEAKEAGSMAWRQIAGRESSAEAVEAEALARSSELAALPTKTFGIPSAASQAELPAPQPPRRSGRAFQKGFILGGHLTITDYEAWRASVLPVLGFYLAYHLSDRWSVQTEAHARFVNNYNLERSINQFSVSADASIISFEASTRLRSYTSIDVPLVVQYRLQPQWSLVAGVRHSFIFENNGALESGEGNYMADLYRQSRSRYQLDRHLWPHDWGVLLGASWHFARSWSLHLRYTQGLRDISPDNLYGDDAYHLNSDLHFSIRKNF